MRDKKPKQHPLLTSWMGIEVALTLSFDKRDRKKFHKVKKVVYELLKAK